MPLSLAFLRPDRRCFWGWRSPSPAPHRLRTIRIRRAGPGQLLQRSDHQERGQRRGAQGRTWAPRSATARSTRRRDRHRRRRQDLVALLRSERAAARRAQPASRSARPKTAKLLVGRPPAEHPAPHQVLAGKIHGDVKPARRSIPSSRLGGVAASRHDPRHLRQRHPPSATVSLGDNSNIDFTDPAVAQTHVDGRAVEFVRPGSQPAQREPARRQRDGQVHISAPPSRWAPTSERRRRRRSATVTATDGTPTIRTGEAPGRSWRPVSRTTPAPRTLRRLRRQLGGGSGSGDGSGSSSDDSGSGSGDGGAGDDRNGDDSDMGADDLGGDSNRNSTDTSDLAMASSRAWRPEDLGPRRRVDRRSRLLRMTGLGHLFNDETIMRLIPPAQGGHPTFGEAHDHFHSGDPNDRNHRMTTTSVRP